MLCKGTAQAVDEANWVRKLAKSVAHGGGNGKVTDWERARQMHDDECVHGTLEAESAELQGRFVKTVTT